MAIYMKHPKVQGSTTNADYKNWIELQSLDFDTQREVSMKPGKSGNRIPGNPSLSTVRVTKLTDASTYGLLQESIHADQGQTIEIAISVGGKSKREWMSYKLESAFIPYMDISAMSSEENDSSVPEETLTISYTKITVDFKEYDKDNKPAKSNKVIFDLESVKTK